jgi:hypothetical protein
LLLNLFFIHVIEHTRSGVSVSFQPFPEIDYSTRLMISKFHLVAKFQLHRNITDPLSQKGFCTNMQNPSLFNPSVTHSE